MAQVPGPGEVSSIGIPDAVPQEPAATPHSKHWFAGDERVSR